MYCIEMYVYCIFSTYVLYRSVFSTTDIVIHKHTHRMRLSDA